MATMLWIAIGSLFVVALLVFLVLWKLRSSSTLQGKERHDITIAYGDLAFKVLGFAALIATVLATIQSVNLAQENIKLSQQTFDNTLKAQTAERYTKAVEQIGSTDESVQIGGLYALKSLLGNPDHHQAVVDLLASFVRLHAKAPQGAVLLPPITKPCDDIPAIQPSENVQVAMTVLAERDSSHESGRLDLRGTYLVGLELRLGAKLVGAILDNANLTYAQLEGTNLETVSLKRAQLSYSCLLQANMNGVVADFSNFEKAILNGVDGPASARCAQMRGVGLVGAKLEGWTLNGAQLQGAFLGQAHLERASVNRADFTDALLNETHLEGTDLRFANGLTEAQLRPAHVSADTLRPIRTEPWSNADCDRKR